jgi:membrane protease YdiL (CAAX protease family)
MRETEILSLDKSPVRKRPERVASLAHLVGFLLIGVGVVVMGFLAQHAPAGGGSAAGSQLASHSKSIPIYLTAIFMDWALLYYCFAGVHHRGGSFWALAGGRWNSWKSVAVDLGIVLPFWVLWEGAAYGVYWLLGPSSAKTVDSLLPQSLLEVLIWIATSITAGVCEEMVFRGYLQRQLHALSGSVVVAVLGQGLSLACFMPTRDGRTWSSSACLEFFMEHWPRGAGICALTSSSMPGPTFGKAGSSSWCGDKTGQTRSAEDHSSVVRSDGGFCGVPSLHRKNGARMGHSVLVGKTQRLLFLDF